MVERSVFKSGGHGLNTKLNTKGNLTFTDFCEIKICKEEDIKVQALKALQ